MSIRLNKLLARRGIGARRKCDALIQEGAVRVNGMVVTEPGTQVEPDRDRVAVRGRPLPPPVPLRYFVLHKPVGVISTLSDPERRRTVAEFLPPGARVFPVGRLDADTSGLLILTNDGELAHHLMHPRYGVEKVYRVRVRRAPGERALEALRGGVEFEPGVRSAPCRVRVLSSDSDHATIEIAIHEGRYRQVRRMCEAVGLGVVALHRSAYGPLRLGPIERGMWRELSGEEVRRLRAAAARPRIRVRGSGQRARRAERGSARPRIPSPGRVRPRIDRSTREGGAPGFAEEGRSDVARRPAPGEAKDRAAARARVFGPAKGRDRDRARVFGPAQGRARDRARAFGPAKGRDRDRARAFGPAKGAGRDRPRPASPTRGRRAGEKPLGPARSRAGAGRLGRRGRPNGR